MRTNGLKLPDDVAMKAMLYRIVAMLTRMAIKFDGIAEASVAYDAGLDNEHEHRCAEHDYPAQESQKPRGATERRK